jgi:RNA polymerase sigma-70 factor (ECF subfamily)
VDCWVAFRRYREPLLNRKPFARSASRVERGDAELLAAIAEGDLGALGVIYDRYARDVWRVVHRVMQGSRDVEDVVHATFLKLPDLARSFDGRASCRNWLCGIGARVALRHGRGLRRLASMLARFGEVVERHSAVDPELIASQREEVASLESALALLSPKRRAVFVLIELEGLDHTSVAEALDIPQATVRTRLFGAREALRSALEERARGGR